MRTIRDVLQTRFEHPDYDPSIDDEPLSFEEFDALTRTYSDKPDMKPSTEAERAAFYRRKAMKAAA